APSAHLRFPSLPTRRSSDLSDTEHIMLSHLSNHQFALVDHLELELQPGVSVITGETGAGKSILLDALGLALGNRADADRHRPGGDKTETDPPFRLNAQADLQVH